MLEFGRLMFIVVQSSPFELLEVAKGDKKDKIIDNTKINIDYQFG